jgi:hypothetical protein
VGGVLAELEADCILLFMVSCEKKINRYMDSQGQECSFNMDAC